MYISTKSCSNVFPTLVHNMSVGGYHNGSIGLNEHVYYEIFPISLDGVIVHLCVSEGLIIIYGSFDVSTPNSSMHDFMHRMSSSDNCTEFSLTPRGVNTTLHISLEGSDDLNTFVVLILPGDTILRK